MKLIQLEKNFNHQIIINVIRFVTITSLIAAMATLFNHALELQVRFFIFIFPLISVIIWYSIRSVLLRFQASLFFSALTLTLVFDAQIDWFIYICLVGFFLHVINFIVFIAYDQWHIKNHTGIYINLLHESWHVALLRMGLGLLLIPNFPAKLFETTANFQSEVQGFVNLGFPNMPELIIFVGLLEAAGALSFILGIGIRFFSITTFILLSVAFVSNGSLNGVFTIQPAYETSTWLFALFWPFLALSFAFFKSDILSLDHYLKHRFKIPKFIKFWM